MTGIIRGMNNSQHEDISARVAAIVENDPAARHTLADLAAAAGVAPATLRRAFQRAYGMTPAAYVRAVRTGLLREALRDGAPVSAAGYEAGFGSDRAIYEHGTRGLGMAPSAYRNGGLGMRIRWSAAPTPLGQMVVGVTDRGVCAVLFAADSRTEQDVLRAEFPSAMLERDDAEVRPHLEEISALLEGRPPARDIPLDLIGTPFQREVWAELRRIPSGETATYAQVARRIGRPRAVRAVASACAGNHAAVVVPCHRVVRTDGGLGGYKWGIERKGSLLDSESG